MTGPRTKPLRVRAYLGSGIVGDEWLPLDSILYFTAMRMRYGRQDITMPGQSHLHVAHGGVPSAGATPALGLRYHHPGPDGFNACSFARWPLAATGKAFWNKRFDSDLAARTLGVSLVTDTGTGRYKDYHMPIWYRHALYVEWYCVGNPVIIVPLLEQTTHLGKKTAYGWGKVLRWTVDEVAADWSVFGPDGELTRAIPLSAALKYTQEGRIFSYARSSYGIRPSYWDSRNQREVAMPTSSQIRAGEEVKQWQSLG